MNNHSIRAQYILERINELAAISDSEQGITRMYGTPAFIAGCQKVSEWMEAAGLQTRIDNIGNVRAVLSCNKPDAKTLVIASHIDTVVNAGRFDGPLGVLMGLDIIEQLTHSDAPLPFHIELIAFCDEEGVRFHTTYLGSQVVTGSFDYTLLPKEDAEGATLQQAIQSIGGNVQKLQADAIPDDKWLGYFEIHIEQGPVLYEKEIPVAVVSSIAGQQRSELIFKGTAGHAGTVPMDMRQDALCNAAEFIVEAEKFALAQKDDIVATVGKLAITDGAANVIPGEVICSMDLRSADQTKLREAHLALQHIAETISRKRNIAFEWNIIQKNEPVACSASMNSLLAQAIKDAGYEVISLTSGAGHDAVPVSAVSPVCMLFVRCFKGISHNPLENVELKDIAAAVKISDNFIQYLIQKHNQ
jgi:allantoate deiminase